MRSAPPTSCSRRLLVGNGLLFDILAAGNFTGGAGFTAEDNAFDITASC
jgi:hypothetical protein